MKKEAFAGLLLAVIFIFSLININYLRDICENICEMIDMTSSDIKSENWEDAENSAREAVEIWYGKGPYTHIFLPHSSIEMVTGDFYELLKAIGNQSAGEAEAAAELIKDRVSSIASTEKIHLGSIF